MRLIAMSAVVALLAPHAASAADFRILDASGASTNVVDLSAIQDTGSGAKSFFFYRATDKAKLIFRSTDKYFLYAAFKYTFDCPNKKVRIDYITLYDDKFSVISQFDAGGRWLDPDPATPPTSEFELYCSPAPGRSAKGVKIRTGDWQGALQIAHNRLLKGVK
jgi:hypothetical protein